MTQAKFENLSALVDGEHADKDVIDELFTDEQLASRWQTYHLIRDGMRNELADEIQLNIADAVADALEKEPTIVAPVIAGESDKSEDKSNVAKPLLGNVLPLFRQGGQFAIAASVAVAVIIGYQQLTYTQQASDLNIAPVKAVSGIPSGLSPVSLSHDTALPQKNVVEQRRKLNALMADHQQQMTLKTSDSAAQDEENEQDAQN